MDLIHLLHLLHQASQILLWRAKAQADKLGHGFAEEHKAKQTKTNQLVLPHNLRLHKEFINSRTSISLTICRNRDSPKTISFLELSSMEQTKKRQLRQRKTTVRHANHFEMSSHFHQGDAVAATRGWRGGVR